jgi:hypothetical protein
MCYFLFVQTSMDEEPRKGTARSTVIPDRYVRLILALPADEPVGPCQEDHD